MNPARFLQDTPEDLPPRCINKDESLAVRLSRRSYRKLSQKTGKPRVTTNPQENDRTFGGINLEVDATFPNVSLMHERMGQDPDRLGRLIK